MCFTGRGEATGSSQAWVRLLLPLGGSSQPDGYFGEAFASFAGHQECFVFWSDFPKICPMKALKSVSVAMLALLLAGCSTLSTSHGLLEYRVDEVRYGPSHMRDFEEHLNAIARDGWSLVGFNDMGSGLRVVASRPRRAP